MATMKVNAAPPCAQNILKRVEERSERECTALDAHKELELVSGPPAFLVLLPCRWASLWKIQINFSICFCNPGKSLGLTVGQVWSEQRGRSSFSTPGPQIHAGWTRQQPSPLHLLTSAAPWRPSVSQQLPPSDVWAFGGPSLVLARFSRLPSRDCQRLVWLSPARCSPAPSPCVHSVPDGGAAAA